MNFLCGYCGFLVGFWLAFICITDEVAGGAFWLDLDAKLDLISFWVSGWLSLWFMVGFDEFLVCL